MAILEVRNLSVSFGAVRAVDDLSLTIDRGRLVGLIGPNGAGKTTFIDAVTGFVPTSGTILYDGEPIQQLRPHARVWRSLSRTFQSIELFGDLTVRENLLVAQENRRRWDILRSRDDSAQLVDWSLTVMGIAEFADAFPSSLSLGTRKLVAVARALASGARLVLLDEPAAGLDSAESREFGAHLKHLRDHDITVLLVDHDISLVLGICEQIHVLNFGRLLASDTPESIRNDPKVRAAYLGEPVAAMSVA